MSTVILSCKGFVHFNYQEEKLLTLKKPLCDIQLSLANADGTMRKTSKSKLAKIVSSRFDTEQAPDFSRQAAAYIMNVMNLIHAIISPPETFEKLA